MNFDPNEKVETEVINGVPVDQDPIEQMKNDSNMAKQRLIAIIVVFVIMAATIVSIYFAFKGGSESPEPVITVVPDCSIVYDCELYTKSEYICKYKDNNNEEKEMKCPWTEVKENQYKKTEPTTNPVSDSKIKNVALNDYYNNIKGKIKDKSLASNDGIIVLDNTFTRMSKFYLGENGGKPCAKDKEIREITENGLNIKYTCEQDPDSYDQGYYTLDVIVNNKFKFYEGNDSTCGSSIHYFSDKYHVIIQTSCGINSAYMIIYDENNNKLFEEEGFAYAYGRVMDNYIDFNNGYEALDLNTNPYIKDNALYYIDGISNTVGNEVVGDDVCYIKKFDFNTQKTSNVEQFACEYADGW